MKKLFFIYNENTNQAVTSPYTTKSRLLAENPLEAGEKVILTTEKDGGFGQLWKHRDSLRFIPQSQALLNLISRLNPSKGTEDTAEALYLKLVDAGIIDDRWKNVGRKVIDLAGQKSVFAICRAIEEFFGVETLRAEDYDAIMHLYVTYVC